MKVSDDMQKALDILKLPIASGEQSATAVQVDSKEVYYHMKAEVLKAWYDAAMLLNFKMTRIKRKGKSKIKRVQKQRTFKLIALHIQLAAVIVEMTKIQAQPFESGWSKGGWTKD